MAEKNASNPRQRFDPGAYSKALAIIDAESNQRLSRTNSSSSAGSESDGRSSSGKSSGSSSYGSTGTAESGNTASVVKAVTALADKDHLKEGVPLHSPPKPSKSEGDKKAPTQLPGRTTGIKKAFSSCCSCLFNGLSSLIKKLNASTSEGQDLSSKKVPSREKKQKKEEVPEKSFFESFRTVVKKMWEKEFEYSIYETEASIIELKLKSKYKGNGTVSMGDLATSVNAAGATVSSIVLEAYKLVKKSPSKMKNTAIASAGFGNAVLNFATTENGYGSDGRSWTDKVRSARGAFAGPWGSSVGVASSARSMAKFSGEALREMMPNSQTFIPEMCISR